MKALAFIRNGMEFELLVANAVDDIVPMLQRAAQGVPEAAKGMPEAVKEKL